MAGLASASRPYAPTANLLHYIPVLDAQGNVVMLGQGGYAAVYQYIDPHNNNEGVAIKRIQLTGLPPHKRDLLARYISSELKNHYLLNHPHVVKLKDVFVTSQHLNIVLELAESGMLFEYVNKRLRENNGQMREDDARWFFQQLVLTMEYFHRRGISHRDIKLENTLLKALPGWTRPIIRVADFGLSKFDAALTFTRVGTSDYMSPEVVMAQRPDGTGVGLGYNGEKADIWSAGVMLYAMLAGHYPFDSNLPDHQRLQLMTQRPIRRMPGNLTPECRQLLEAMLHPDQHERISIAGIKSHPWFLRDLPLGALSMTESYINAPPPCARSPQELQAAIDKALRLLGAPAPAGAAQ